MASIRYVILPLQSQSWAEKALTEDRSAALLLSSLGYIEPAAKINAAVDAVLLEGQYLTPDLGGKSSTSDVTEAVLKGL